jgi:hypothetical protein
MTNTTQIYRNTTFREALRNYKAPSQKSEENRSPTKNYSGKAYAFFNCNRSQQEIEAELPMIRDLTKTSKNLELTLTEGVTDIKGDKKLMEVAKEAQAQGMRYCLQAELPKKDNQETAQALSGILNQAYQSQLYTEGECFSGGIVYKKRSRYQFLE